MLADRPIPADFYTSGTTPQRGQLLGAALGPGGSSQWLSVAYVRDAWQAVGDASVSRTTHSIASGSPVRHDVAVTGGLRGTALLPGVEAPCRFSLTDRMNYLLTWPTWAACAWSTCKPRLALYVPLRRARRAPAAPPRP